MKKLLLALVMVALYTVSAFSQDVIVKKNGSTILCKVIEIGVSEIKYKKWDNLDGPNYSVLLAEAQTINYENGRREVLNNLSDSLSFVKQFDTYTRERYLHISKSWQTVGVVYFWANVIAGCTIAFIHNDYGSDFALIMGGAVLDGAVGAIIFNEIGRYWGNKANQILTTSSLIRKDFKLGNTRLSAGLDMISNKVTKERSLGVAFGLDL